MYQAILRRKKKESELLDVKSKLREKKSELWHKKSQLPFFIFYSVAETGFHRYTTKNIERKVSHLVLSGLLEASLWWPGMHRTQPLMAQTASSSPHYTVSHRSSETAPPSCQLMYYRFCTCGEKEENEEDGEPKTANYRRTCVHLNDADFRN